jgi:hypothetical protein
VNHRDTLLVHADHPGLHHLQQNNCDKATNRVRFDTDQMSFCIFLTSTILFINLNKLLESKKGTIKNMHTVISDKQCCGSGKNYCG